MPFSRRSRVSPGRVYCDSLLTPCRHCVPVGVSQSENSSISCELPEREYDIPLRIGTLFVVLFASALGVFSPIFLAHLSQWKINALVFTVGKQFGTGVIISTAFVHVGRKPSVVFDSRSLTLACSFTPTLLSCSTTNVSEDSSMKLRRPPS